MRNDASPELSTSERTRRTTIPTYYQPSPMVRSAVSTDHLPPLHEPVALLVRKLARAEKPYATLCLALCEEDDSHASRYVSRLMLRPGRYPPKFIDEDETFTLQRRVPNAFQYVHGKVVTASYLLEQMSLTCLGVMSIFGDAISDVYMVHSLFTDSFYSTLSLDVFGIEAKQCVAPPNPTAAHALAVCMALISSHGRVCVPVLACSWYLWLTVASLATWLVASGAVAAWQLSRAWMVQHRAESRARTALHFCAMWVVLAFNVPFWMLNLANPHMILKSERRTKARPRRAAHERAATARGTSARRPNRAAPQRPSSSLSHVMYPLSAPPPPS